MLGAQHQNGAAEILIKLVKGVIKSLRQAARDNVLSLNEMNTLLSEASNLVNELPFGVRPIVGSDPEYLSPNSLYLGRCSARVSAGPFQPKDVFEDDTTRAFRNHFQLIEVTTDQFWKIWR